MAEARRTSDRSSGETTAIARVVNRRVARIEWTAVAREIDERGWCRLGTLLTARECRGLIGLYQHDEHFRSTVDMERYRFGRGQYRYFQRPLPPLVQELREALYTRLAAVANLWAEQLERPVRYPARFADFAAQCRAGGQTRPTPLLLRYGAGDFNRLHQDLYGAVAFPLQVLIVLSARGADYDGGEVIFLEQAPRTQSKPTAITVDRGEALVFTNRDRPVRGTRGWYAMQMRHGASEVTRGQRYVLGLIFHDAE